MSLGGQCRVNGTLTTYVYNANDQLTQETTGLDVTTYQYDANGSTVLKRLNGTETARYSYDSRNRMIGSMTNGIDSTYVYDHAGIRREKIEGNVSTTFLVDPTQAYTQVIEELDNQGRVQVSYTFGDDLISQQRFDELGAFESSFYHYDGLGSTRLLTDFSGATLNEYVYEAFGEIEHQTGSTENLYLFTGEQYDPNLGFYYLRARYYNPANGRFHTLDTYMGNNADPVTLHKYLYANADPVGMIDPSGKVGLAQFAVANGILGGLITAGLGYESGQTFGKIFTNFTVGAATGVAFGAVFGVGANLIKAAALSRFPAQLQSPAILSRLGIGGSLFPGRSILGSRMVMQVGSEKVLLQSGLGPSGVTGALKHIAERLGTSATAGQTTAAELLMMQEAEAAIHIAMRQGLVNTAVANSMNAAYAARGINVVVQSGSWTWEITAQLVVQNGERFVKIFHMLPL